MQVEHIRWRLSHFSSISQISLTAPQIVCSQKKKKKLTDAYRIYQTHIRRNSTVQSKMQGNYYAYVTTTL